MRKAAKVIFICLLAGFLVAHIVATRKSDVDNHQLIIFHAGSLAVPFKQICQQFRKSHPDIKIICEAAGSRLCARKISDLQRACDVMVSADYTVIDTLLIGKYADWNTLRTLFEEHGDADLEQFFAQWVRSGGAPNLQLVEASGHSDSESLEVVIDQGEHTGAMMGHII